MNVVNLSSNNSSSAVAITYHHILEFARETKKSSRSTAAISISLNRTDATRIKEILSASSLKPRYATCLISYSLERSSIA